MADVVYNRFKYQQLGDTSVTPINFKTDTIKVALTTASYTPDVDAHDFFDDVTNEVSGTGYSAGGATLSSPATSQDNTDNEGVFDSADPTWSTATISNARYAILYKSTGNAATSPLIAAFDLGGNVSVVAGTLTLTVHSEGWINIT